MYVRADRMAFLFVSAAILVPLCLRQRMLYFTHPCLSHLSRAPTPEAPPTISLVLAVPQVLYNFLQGVVLVMLIFHGIKYISFQPRLAQISKTLVGELCGCERDVISWSASVHAQRLTACLSQPKLRRGPTPPPAFVLRTCHALPQPAPFHNPTPPGRHD